MDSLNVTPIEDLDCNDKKRLETGGTLTTIRNIVGIAKTPKPVNATDFVPVKPEVGLGDNKIAYIGGGMGGLVVILSLVALCVSRRRKKNKNKLEIQETVDENPDYGED